MEEFPLAIATYVPYNSLVQEHSPSKKPTRQREVAKGPKSRYAQPLFYCPDKKIHNEQLNNQSQISRDTWRKLKCIE